MEDNNHKPSLRCSECHREIDLGHDIITVEKAVSGPRGIVPLGDVATFCSEQCVSAYFDGTPASDLPEVPFKVP